MLGDFLEGERFTIPFTHDAAGHLRTSNERRISDVQLKIQDDLMNAFGDERVDGRGQKSESEQEITKSE